MDFTQFNKGFQTIDWKVDTKGWPFKKPKDLGDKFTTQVSGFFFTRSKLYEKVNPVAIGQGFLIPFSSTQTEKVKEVLENQEAIEAIKRGECWIRIRKYRADKYNADGYSFDFVEAPIF